LLDDEGIERRWRSEIEKAVTPCTHFLVEFRQALCETAIGLRIIVSACQVGNLALKAGPESAYARFEPGVVFYTVVQAAAVFAVGKGAACQANDPGLRRQKPLAPKAMQRRYKLSSGQVTGSTKYDNGGWLSAPG
jgi:hypothetical protein